MKGNEAMLVVNNRIVYRDPGHLTVEGAALFKNSIRRIFEVLRKTPPAHPSGTAANTSF
jgi:hypothetical protein